MVFLDRKGNIFAGMVSKQSKSLRGENAWGAIDKRCSPHSLHVAFLPVDIVSSFFSQLPVLFRVHKFPGGLKLSCPFVGTETKAQLKFVLQGMTQVSKTRAALELQHITKMPTERIPLGTGITCALEQVPCLSDAKKHWLTTPNDTTASTSSDVF